MTASHADNGMQAVWLSLLHELRCLLDHSETWLDDEIDVGFLIVGQVDIEDFPADLLETADDCFAERSISTEDQGCLSHFNKLI